MTSAMVLLLYMFAVLYTRLKRNEIDNFKYRHLWI